MRPRLQTELTAHVLALRALARLLVGDGAAEDLVQDTALVALRSPPAEVSGMRGWLSQVLRRLASNHRRGEARRARRERATAPPRPTEPAARVAEHHETVQRMTAALLGLPEPYHSTLLLRFFEDLTPTAIAEQTDVPLATVKSRLQRGLKLLRERLDDSATGEDWRPALAAAFGLPHAGEAGVTAAAAVTTVTTGVMVMGTSIKLAAVAAAVALAASAFFWLQSEPPPAPVTERVAGAPAAAATAAGSSERGDPAAARPIDRREQQASSTPAAPAGGATLRGRCVDEQGRPVADVTVRLTGDAPGGESPDPRVRETPAEVRESQTTGADGVFVFVLPPPLPAQCGLSLLPTERAAMRGHVAQLGAGSVEDLGDLVLPRGVRIRGRVVDTVGAPVGEALVALAGEAQGAGTIRPRTDAHGVTRPDGTFVTHWPVVAGEYHFRVEPGGRPKPAHVTLDGSQPVVDVTLVVDESAAADGPSIRGVVVDESGMPVAGARVDVAGYTSRGGRTGAATRTDRDGGFELLRPAPNSPAEVSLVVQKDGFEDHSPERQFAWGDDDVRVVLPRALAVVVSVVAADDGAPVEDFAVRVFPAPQTRGAIGSVLDVRARGRHSGGRVRVTGIARGPWCVLVEPGGDALATSTFVPVRVTGPGDSHVTVRLPRRVERLLRVRDAAGDPVAGTRVELGDMRGMPPTVESRVHPPTSANWAQPLAGLLLQETVTDARGEALLRGPAGAALALFLRGPGHVQLARGDVRLDRDGPLEITVTRGGRLAGKVTPLAALGGLRRLAGLPETGQVEVARRGLLPGLQLLRVAPSEGTRYHDIRPAPIGTDGSFAFEGVAPGAWQLGVSWWERSSAGGRRGTYDGKHAIVATVDVRDGVTTEIAPDLSSLLPGTLDGVVFRNGEPAADLPLQLRAVVGEGSAASGGYYTRHLTTDADGRFRLFAPSGDYELSGWTDRTELRAAERGVVVAGRSTAQTFRLRSGRLRLRLLDSEGSAVPGVRIDMIPATTDPDARRVWLPRTDAEGRTTVEADIVPLGFTVLPKRLQDPKAWQDFVAARPDGVRIDELHLELGTFTPRAGETTEVELRLPAGWDR